MFACLRVTLIRRYFATHHLCTTIQRLLVLYHYLRSDFAEKYFPYLKEKGLSISVLIVIDIRKKVRLIASTSVIDRQWIDIEALKIFLQIFNFSYGSRPP